MSANAAGRLSARYGNRRQFHPAVAASHPLLRRFGVGAGRNLCAVCTSGRHYFQAGSTPSSQVSPVIGLSLPRQLTQLYAKRKVRKERLKFPVVKLSVASRTSSRKSCDHVCENAPSPFYPPQTTSYRSWHFCRGHSPVRADWLFLVAGVCEDEARNSAIGSPAAACYSAVDRYSAVYAGIDGTRFPHWGKGNEYRRRKGAFFPR